MALLTSKNNLNVSNIRIFDMIENYIYLYNIDTFIVIPSFSDSVTDSFQVSYAETYPLSRSAPIYSFQHSGPRTVQLNFDLHRDEMKQLNYGVSNARIDKYDDYVDIMVKQIQAAGEPAYNASGKVVDPPVVALRMGNDIYIKGIITGGIHVTYKYPILSDGRYACVNIGFSISEIDPYDAETAARVGGFRGVDTTMERKLKGTAGSSLLAI